MDTEQYTPSFSGLRRFGAWINLGVALASVLAIVVMLNYLGARHFTISYWSPDRSLELSQQTKQVLAGLTNDVRVIVFYDPKEALYPMVSKMIEDYRRLSTHIRVETVNYTHNPGRADVIKQQYRLSPASDKDIVIFECAGRTKIVHNADLSDYDLSKILAGEDQEIKRKAFSGEPHFTSAILTVSSSVRPRVYFLAGHGESDPENAKAVVGYGKFAAQLYESNVALGHLQLHGTNEVPAECNAIVIAGARNRLTTTEIEKLDRYLTRGGRILLLFPGASQSGPEGESGLEILAAHWGVNVGVNTVVDLENSGTDDGIDIRSMRYGQHPVVKPLAQNQMPVDLVRPRTVTKRDQSTQKADALQVTELVSTGPNAVAHADIEKGVIRPNAFRDVKGTLSLAIAVERAPVPGVQLGGARMIVVGDSLFLNNEMIESGANREFGHLAMDWLLDRSQLLGIGARPTATYTLVFTQGQMQSLRWIFLGAIPGSVFGLGVLVWWRRRH